MPDYLGLLRGLMDVLGPREAEARVVSREPDLRETLDDLRARPEEAVLPQLYHDIVTAADQRPEQVTLSYDKALVPLRRLAQTGTNPGDPASDIWLRPDVTRTFPQRHHITAHELLHFLLTHRLPETSDTPRQHDIMDYLFGTRGLPKDTTRPLSRPLTGSIPTREDLSTLEALQELVKDPGIRQRLEESFQGSVSVPPEPFRLGPRSVQEGSR